MKDLWLNYGKTWDIGFKMEKRKGKILFITYYQSRLLMGGNK